MKCFNHNTVDAVAQCNNCGIGVCKECVGNYTINNKVTCINCAPTIKKEVQAGNRKIILYVVIGLLPIIGLVILFLFDLIYFGTLNPTNFADRTIQSNATNYLFGFPMILSAFVFWNYAPRILPNLIIFGNSIFWIIYLIIYLPIRVIWTAIYGIYIGITNIKTIFSKF